MTRRKSLQKVRLRQKLTDLRYRQVLLLRRELKWDYKTTVWCSRGSCQFQDSVGTYNHDGQWV